MVLSLVASVFLLCCYSSSSAQQLGITDCSTDGSVNFITGTTCAEDPATHLQQSQPVFDSTQNVLPNFQSGTLNSNATANIVTWNGNDELWFQHTQDTWELSIAINQALRSAGIKIDGYHMQMEIFNKNHNTIGGNCLVAKTNGKCLDVLELKVVGYDAAGNVISTETYDYSGLDTHNINPNLADPNWSQQNILAWAPTQLEVANVQVEIFGYDAGYWAGNYGPRIKNMVGSVIYSADICASNPLHDATCSGYGNALFTQACTSNPLFDPACPGYANALLTQQCTANPLTDPACPGYANAYYNQQCSLNPLFDSGCTGYAQAYFNQQCKLDPLYDSGCTGYQTAYLNQQCSLDPLYDPQCTGYDAAYQLQQCDLDALYDITCIGYQQAYIEQQCQSDPLYDVTCIGYNEAIALQDATEEYVDDGIVDTDIDIVGITIVEGVPNVMTLPEIPPVQIIELESTIIEEEYNMVEGDALAMEDDIEREIAELERVEEEPVEEEIVVITEDGSDEETPGDKDGSVGGQGETTSEDDIEKEIAELEEIEITEDGSDEELANGDIVPSEEIDEPEKKKVVKKKTSKDEKIKMLLAKKAIELTKRVEESVSIEQQMLVQRQLLALISYVPGFDYSEKKLPQVNFYPPKPVVDHAYARWFLNDPNFVAMEDLQYNFN